MSELSELLRTRRQECGFSQKGLAVKSGVTWRAIQYIEDGERNPSPPTAVALAEALGITRDELFTAMGASGEYCWWPTVDSAQLPPLPKTFPPNLEAFLIEAGVLS